MGADAFPDRQLTEWRQISLAPHTENLTERWRAGCHNVTKLCRAFHDERGSNGGLTTVLAWARNHRRNTTDESVASRPRLSAAAQSSCRPSCRPSPRRAAWLLSAPEKRLKAPDLRYVETVCSASPALATVHGLAMEVRRMLEAHDPNARTPWVHMAAHSELRTLRCGLRRRGCGVRRDHLPLEQRSDRRSGEQAQVRSRDC